MSLAPGSGQGPLPATVRDVNLHIFIRLPSPLSQRPSVQMLSDDALLRATATPLGARVNHCIRRPLAARIVRPRDRPAAPGRHRHGACFTEPACLPALS